MKKQLLLLALLFASIVVMSQEFSWTELGTGKNAFKPNGTIRSICTDAAGQVYAAGDFTDASGNYYIAMDKPVFRPPSANFHLPC